MTFSQEKKSQLLNIRLLVALQKSINRNKNKPKQKWERCLTFCRRENWQEDKNKTYVFNKCVKQDGKHFLFNQGRVEQTHIPSFHSTKWDYRKVQHVTVENEPAEEFVFGPLVNEICTHRFKTAKNQ